MEPHDNNPKLIAKLESKTRHSRQNKAMRLLIEQDNKRLLAENKQLKQDIVYLKQQLSIPRQPKELVRPITTRQGLFRAGLCNVHPNDVLRFTPILVDAYKSTPGKTVIERVGMVPCFPNEDLDFVIGLIEQLAPEHLGTYWAKRMSGRPLRTPCQ